MINFTINNIKKIIDYQLKNYDFIKEQISKYDASRFYSKQENAAGRMVDATANAIRDGIFALTTPVITSVDGLCVAVIKWIPAARAS